MNAVVYVERNIELTVYETVEIAKLFRFFGILEADEGDFLAMVKGRGMSATLRAQLLALSTYRQCGRAIIEVLGEANAHLFPTSRKRVAA